MRGNPKPKRKEKLPPGHLDMFSPEFYNKEPIMIPYTVKKIKGETVLIPKNYGDLMECSSK